MKYGGRAFLGIFIAVILTIGWSPSFAMWTGNIFFGQVKSLYNVTLAQQLYRHAVSPLFGQKVPAYAYHQLSRTYFIKGDLPQSIEYAKKELQLYPEHTRTYYILGLTYGYLNMLPEAIEAFSVYIEHHPETWAGRNDKAWLQFRMGDISGALATIEPAAVYYKTVPWVQNTYCNLLINSNRFSDAETVCMQARELIDNMTEEGWGRSYPGNDPRTYATGLQAMKISINKNIEILSAQKAGE